MLSKDEENEEEDEEKKLIEKEFYEPLSRKDKRKLKQLEFMQATKTKFRIIGVMQMLTGIVAALVGGFGVVIGVIEIIIGLYLMFG
jgi:hypothetical protein